MRTSRVVMLILGCFSALLGVALLCAGAFLSWGYFIQRDGGEITLPQERYETASSALVSNDIDIFDSANRPDALGFDSLGRITLKATASSPGSPVFIGIGPTDEVNQYLRNVAHTRIDEVTYDPFRVKYDEVPGDRTATPPAQEQLWSGSIAGSGTQELSWDLQDGSWTAVVMNADASPGVAVELQPGVHFDFLGPLAVTVLAIAAVFLLIGIPLIVVGAIGLGRHPQALPTAPAAAAKDTATSTAPSDAYPATLTGERDPSLSRWLWLVKWLLVIPHYIVLLLLGIAFLFTTIAAGLSILFTGRYPRGLFDFNVGVLRWAWRVQFYAYSALGTDRYPPFTLQRTDYPADFSVDYPEKLSRGLVLVKWWLLAIPHYIVLAILAGGWYAGFRIAGDDGVGSAGQPYLFSSLLGLLILIVGIGLLFTGRYPGALFDFIMGINRWAFRVAAYAALMRDEYPPFRMDQGPYEPTSGHQSPGSAHSTPPRPEPSPVGAPARLGEHPSQRPEHRDWFNA
ncbi:DUF4389 domain-containing protein [Williamsia muralis]|uniref:DUF4389 domain-containing protein n=1 Tax=Williamsia marianensis TaxID=85044 RepID=A0ABU4F127_WILMA|nr:DUF4389 domain-containing protein [Williamsia muralis]MDV7136574.1 DUF4389 domain-containing protein [Williamsia muralis]